MGRISGEFYQIINNENGRKYWSLFSKQMQIKLTNVLRKIGIKNIRSYKKTTETLMHLYAFVKRDPMICIDQASKGLGIAYNTVAKYIEILQELGI